MKTIYEAETQKIFDQYSQESFIMLSSLQIEEIKLKSNRIAKIISEFVKNGNQFDGEIKVKFTLTINKTKIF